MDVVGATWSVRHRAAANQHRQLQQHASLGAQSSVGLWSQSHSCDGLWNVDGKNLQRRSSGSSRRVKVPPRPARAFAVFDVVQQALRERLRLTGDESQHAGQQNDAGCNSTTRQSTPTAFCISQVTPSDSIGDNQQLRSMLSKVEELLERYTVQDRMREAALRMADAYAKSNGGSSSSSGSGGSKRAPIANLHKNHKECSKEMCSIETQMDVALGQVHCKIAGVNGFARVLPGDVYEAVIRIGEQKWKCRGRIAKDGSQKWTKDERTFTIRSDYCMKVKIFECKTIGRQLLGERQCDVLGLISAIPQVLTIDASTAGTIKLNVAAEWDPLVHIAEWTFPDYPGDRKQRLSVSVSHTLSMASANSTSLLTSTLGRKHGGQNGDLFGRAGDPVEGTLRPANEDNDPDHMWYRTVAEAVSAIQQALRECVDPSSPALTKLGDLMLPLRAAAEMWRTGATVCGVCRQQACPVCGKRMHDDAFSDATNVDDGYNGVESPKRCIVDNESPTCEGHYGGMSCHVGASNDSMEAESVRSAATSATADSGIHSGCVRILRPHHDGSTHGGTLTAAAAAAALGYSDLDIVAMQHLTCCQQLLQRIQNQDILPAERDKWMGKLVQQTRLLASLYCLFTHGGLLRSDGSIDVTGALDEMGATDPVREFWCRATRSSKLYLTREQFMRSLERMHITGTGDGSELRVNRTCSLMASHIIGSALYPSQVRPRLVVTLLQLVDFMAEKAYYGLNDFAADVAAELWLLDSLKSGNSVIITRAIHSLQDTVPADEVVRMLLSHLASPHVNEGASAAAVSRSLRKAALPK